MKKVILMLLMIGLTQIAQALPRGDYLRTCGFCTYTNGTLSCACFDTFGYLNQTIMAKANECGWVSNEDGNLLCGYFKHHIYHQDGEPPLPPQYHE